MVEIDKELPDHSVLVVLDEEESKELLDWDAKKQGAEHIAREMAKAIGEANQGINDWFYKIREKYDIGSGDVYVNTPTNELRKGKA